MNPELHPHGSANRGPVYSPNGFIFCFVTDEAALKASTALLGEKMLCQ